MSSDHFILQYVVSGSDDFNVYIWEVPNDWAYHEELMTIGRAYMVLRGHRSIVNQVRFNPATHMLISAGVEKVVKVSLFLNRFIRFPKRIFIPNLQKYFS